MTSVRGKSTGTVALSWGESGGFYVHRHRICLGRVALTYVPVEIDALMRAYSDETQFTEVCWEGDHAACMAPSCACGCHQ